jgi:hypothetical protein
VKHDDNGNTNMSDVSDDDVIFVTGLEGSKTALDQFTRSRVSSNQ